MMSSKHRTRLQQLTTKAVDFMAPDIDSVINSLISDMVVTPNMEMEIRSHPNKLRQARELHMLIMRRGDDAYDKYYRALRIAGMDPLAKYMENLLNDRRLSHYTVDDLKEQLFSSGCSDMQVDVPQTRYDQRSGLQETTGQLFDPPADLPDNWPAPDYKPMEMLLRKCELDDSDTKRKLQEMSKGLAYDLPHGRALIINNKKFGVKLGGGDSLDHRVGTDIDCTLMDITLSDMQFDVIVEKDCTAEKIKFVIQRELTKLLSKKCFVCVILSHGTMGAVYGVDGELVKLSELIELTDTMEMVGVPKVFIIQACQGESKNKGMKCNQPGPGGDSPLSAKTMFGDRDMGVNHENMETTSQDETAVKQTHAPQQPEDANVKLQVPPNLPKDYEKNFNTVEEQFKDMNINKDSPDAVGEIVANKANIFIATATAPGYVSWRNEARGAWFIQALVFVLKKWAYCEHIDDLFTMVTRLVASQEHQTHGYKQIAEKKSTLLKKLYFFPGVTEQDIKKQ